MSAHAMAAQGATQTAKRAAQTDPRWYPWLGCWTSDSTDGRALRGAVSCIVPVSGSAAVEALSLVDGQVVSRQRIDASGRPQAIDNQGCSGSQVANWATSGERVYLRADYTCNTGIKGTSQSLYALSPTGDWIQVDQVRAGSSPNGIVSVDRLHDAGIPAGLPRDAASALESRRLAIATSRAAAARPLTTDDVVDAMHHTDASIVRSWIGETGQRFSLTGQQINSLAAANVPSTVLQAMMGNPVTEQPVYADSTHTVEVYRGSAIAAEGAMQPGVYQPGVYQPGVVQPYVESNYYYYPAAPYGYSMYNPYLYVPYYPFTRFIQRRSFPHSVFIEPRGAPIVGIRTGTSFTSPMHGNPSAPQHPVTRGPSGRHRP
jgi:hypothetical protein